MIQRIMPLCMPTFAIPEDFGIRRRIQSEILRRTTVSTDDYATTEHGNVGCMSEEDAKAKIKRSGWVYDKLFRMQARRRLSG